jgi:NAD/NADP transhydrogenase alpha subunit
MRIGCPKEIKNREYRVGLTPESAKELVKHGHEVWVETEAGTGIGASDREYEAAGAKIHPDPEILFAECEMIVKVKEPQPNERAMLREGQILYTYLHLAPDPEQTADLVRSGVTAIAYETVTGEGGTLPLLKPMSQVAGRMSIQAGATALEKAHGGRGVLLGGVPGVMPGKVVIIGGGVVGFNAAQMAVGLRPRRRRDDPRPQPRGAGAVRHSFRGLGQDALLQPRQPRGRGVRGGPGDRRGADPRRRRPQAGHPRHAPLHEAGRGARRRGDRPGRLL